MNPSTMAAGSWMILVLLAIEIISEGAASQFWLFDHQHDAKIKCVNDYQIFVREGISRMTCMFLCYTKQECAGARFDQTSEACYGCALFSEVAPGSEMDSNSMFYTYSGKFLYLTVNHLIAGTDVVIHVSVAEPDQLAYRHRLTKLYTLGCLTQHMHLDIHRISYAHFRMQDRTNTFQKQSTLKKNLTMKPNAKPDKFILKTINV